MIGGSLFVDNQEVCKRKNVPSIMNKQNTYHIKSESKISEQGMTSVVYSYDNGHIINVIKHSDKNYMNEQQLIESVGIQMVIHDQMKMAPETTDFFLCHNNPKQYVLVMTRVGATSFKNYMNKTITNLEHGKIDVTCIKVCENLLHFYSALKLSNYIMNYRIGVIHGDLHHGNIQVDVTDGLISKIYYIDFDFSTWIFKELEKLKDMGNIDKLNYMNYFNGISNKNNLHTSKMILDHCNKIMTTLNLYYCPFGTPMTSLDNISITNAETITSTIHNIQSQYVFTSGNPLAYLLILLLLIYRHMFMNSVIAPYTIGYKPYIYNDVDQAFKSITSEMTTVWQEFVEITGISTNLTNTFSQLLPCQELTY